MEEIIKRLETGISTKNIQLIHAASLQLFQFAINKAKLEKGGLRKEFSNIAGHARKIRDVVHPLVGLTDFKVPEKFFTKITQEFAKISISFRNLHANV